MPGMPNLRPIIPDRWDVTIRPFEPGDREKIFEIHQRESKRNAGFPGAPQFTKFSDPLDARNVYTLVAIDPEGRIIALLTGRIIAELQLLADHEAAAPRSILAAINRLWEEMRPLLWSKGIADVVAPVAKWFPGFIKSLRRQKFGYNVPFKEDSDRVHFVYDIRADMEPKP